MTLETSGNLADADREQLAADFSAMLAAWSTGDAVAYADLFARDVCYVGFDGYAFRSRAELRNSHAELFGGVLRGSRLVGSVERIRPLGADVAVMHCRGAVITRGRKKPGRGRESVQTIVAHRNGSGGGWIFTDFHNTRYRPLPALIRWWMRASVKTTQ